MTKPSFVYVTYIVTTPQKVWDAITDETISAAYWQRANVSDWKVGSAWAHQLPGKAPDLVGRVLEADPPRRLVLSWAAPTNAQDPTQTSKVAFDIEPVGEKVRLTVSHTELTQEAYRDVSEGWPAVLANMKAYLETGRTMPDAFGGIHR